MTAQRPEEHCSRAEYDCLGVEHDRSGAEHSYSASKYSCSGTKFAPSLTKDNCSQNTVVQRFRHLSIDGNIRLIPDFNGPDAFRRPRNNTPSTTHASGAGINTTDKAMSNSQTPIQVLAEAGKIVDTWIANPGLKLGDMDLATFTKARDDLATTHTTLESKRTELSGMVDVLHDQTHAVHELVVRARSGFHAAYGADSVQYGQVGGTRTSERSSGLHRGVVTPTPAPKP
jgi:hypothetical protein